MEVDSEELTVFLKQVSQAVIDSGLVPIEPIEIELVVVNMKKDEGGIKIFVVDAKREVGAEKISRIRIKATPRQFIPPDLRRFLGLKE